MIMPLHTRVALVRDYREERWTSMDLVADSLEAAIRGLEISQFQMEAICAPFLNRLDKLRGRADGEMPSIADRLINRAWDYPRWLKGQLGRHDLYHIVDHSYAQLALVTPSQRTVVTCHDLDAFRCLLQPELEPRPYWFRLYSKRILAGLQRAAHLIFVSETVRKSAIAQGLTTETRSSVIYNGIHPTFLAPPQPADLKRIEDLLRERGAGKAILLHVGSTIPRKRIDLLLEIFARCRKNHPELILVRVGGRFNETQMKLAADLGVAEEIVTMPFLSTGELTALYRQAALLVQCSDAEGFGLPVVEAMACGCPVVASDLEVLREVGGAAACYCRVGDLEEWTAEIGKLLKAKRSQSGAWEQLQQSMSTNTVRFSWARTAHSTVDIYRTLVNNSTNANHL